jgi:broad specificity phosphatase PhoE
MRTVALLRHGQTANHAENRYTGTTDIPLDARGQAQAEDLAAWARTVPVAGVCCSDLVRSRTTAGPLAAAAGVPLRVDPGFAELDFGAGEGLTAAEMRTRFPAARRAFEADPAGHPLPGGEAPVAAVRRAGTALRAALDAGAAAPPGHILVIVSHSTLLRLLVMELIGMALSRYRTVLPTIRPASGVVLRTDGRHAGFLAVNPDLVPGRSFEA